MQLFINTSKDKELDVFLIKNSNVIDSITITGDYKLSEKLIVNIDKLLKKNKCKMSQIKGLITVTGPGAFTSLRIAISIVNTLSYVLSIPSIGMKFLAIGDTGKYANDNKHLYAFILYCSLARRSIASEYNSRKCSLDRFLVSLSTYLISPLRLRRLCEVFLRLVEVRSEFSSAVLQFQKLPLLLINKGLVLNRRSLFMA